MPRSITYANIPQKRIGPIRITGPVLDDEVVVPLATFETPLWSSTNRGARVTHRAGGIRVTIADDRMTRSLLIEAPSATTACDLVQKLTGRPDAISELVASTSRFARFAGLHSQVVGNLLFLRLEMSTGDASGHNMATLAAERVLDWILIEYPEMRHVSVSGNYCTDKKTSSVNGILGRGKYVIAETLVSSRLCSRYLKTKPEDIISLNIRKNLIGSIIAGGVRTANAHFANALLAFYLATGQDAANIIEGSQGIVHTECRDDDLYFSVTLPNVIVGTVGNGKDLEFARENLMLMGCLEERSAGANARRLAAIAGATVLCAELSLMAALTNPGELMKSHTKFERKKT